MSNKEELACLLAFHFKPDMSFSQHMIVCFLVVAVAGGGTANKSTIVHSKLFKLT